MQVPELIGGASGLGWVAVKAVLLFTVAVIGLRLGERRTLAQLSAFDFAVAVAIGAIIGRGATASDTSFATSAVALVTFLVAHRVIAIGRRHSRVVRLIDHPPRVLVAGGELQDRELARAGLTHLRLIAVAPGRQQAFHIRPAAGRGVAVSSRGSAHDRLDARRQQRRPARREARGWG
jgi:hypothetical protein